MSKKVTIIGGGIIGLASAYYLQANGHQVRVIEQKSVGDSCAQGNAGYISPSHFIPLAAPGMVKKGLRWLFDPESPFYLHPRFDLDFFSWLWQFNRYCSERHVQAVKKSLFELCMQSRELYLAMSQQLDHSFQLQLNGCYVLSKTSKALAAENKIVDQAKRLGMQAVTLDAAQIQQRFPEMQFAIEGGVFFPEDAHVQPGLLLKNLYEYLQKQDVEFIEHCSIEKISFKANQVESIFGNGQQFAVEELVIAAGCWSPKLAAMLNLKVPVQAGKGYSVTIDNPWSLDTPMILNESAVAITPLNGQIRFGGTMEFAGINLAIDQQRINGILKSVKNYLPDFEPASVDRDIAWAGLRPCTPDGLPMIGRMKGYNNLILATGHAMLGLTLAPVTGLLVSQIVAGEKCQWQEKISPHRFG